MPRKWPYIFSYIINSDHLDDQLSYYFGNFFYIVSKKNLFINKQKVYYESKNGCILYTTFVILFVKYRSHHTSEIRLSLNKLYSLIVIKIEPFSLWTPLNKCPKPLHKWYSAWRISYLHTRLPFFTFYEPNSSFQFLCGYYTINISNVYFMCFVKACEATIMHKEYNWKKT